MRSSAANLTFVLHVIQPIESGRMTTPTSADAMPQVGQLVTRACERALLEDFGGDSWRDGLALLVQSVESAAVGGN